MERFRVSQLVRERSAPSGNPAGPGAEMITITRFPYRKRAIAFHQTKWLFRSRKVAIPAPSHEKRALFNPILAARLSMRLFITDLGRPVSVPSMERLRVSQLGYKRSTFVLPKWFNQVTPFGYHCATQMV